MSDLDTAVFRTTARVGALIERATAAELTTIAQGRAQDPEVFADHAPFFWPNEISSDRLDAYYTRMDPATTLPNFAREAAAGVAFLAGHNNRVLPFGSTLTGTLESAPGVTRVTADAYTLSGIELGGVRADDFILGVRSGIIRDVSVGFHGGQWICSICGKDMLRDWDCWHIPGLAYEVKDAETSTITIVREVIAEALIRDAHLSEVSAVYDGATPGAAILQAQRQAEAGRIRPEQARLIEQRYRIHLPDRRLVVPGASIPTPTPADDPAPPAQPVAAGDRAAPTPEEPTPMPMSPENLAELRSVCGLAEDADPIAHLRALSAELPQLRALAAEGKAAREALIEEALGEAVRALGAEAHEANAPVLASLPSATIRQMRDSWRAIAAARLPGGRQSTDEAPAGDEGDKPAAQAEPEHLFRG